MAFTLKPHEYRRNPDTGVASLTRLNPYVRLRRMDVPDAYPVYVQGGAFYSEDGKEIAKTDLPKWLPEELAKLSPKARKEVGIGDLKV